MEKASWRMIEAKENAAVARKLGIDRNCLANWHEKLNINSLVRLSGPKIVSQGNPSLIPAGNRDSHHSIFFGMLTILNDTE